MLNMLRDIAAEIAEIKSDVKAVWAEARKTNGRVNGHDTDIAVIQTEVAKRSKRRDRAVGWVVGFISASLVVVVSAVITAILTN